jgi:hypothetical protein
LPAVRCLELPPLLHTGIGSDDQCSGGYCRLAAGIDDERTAVVVSAAASDAAATAAATPSSPSSASDGASANADACVLRHGRFAALRTVEIDMLALYSASELSCALALLAHSGAGVTTAAIRAWPVEVCR